MMKGVFYVGLRSLNLTTILKILTVTLVAKQFVSEYSHAVEYKYTTIARVNEQNVLANLIGEPTGWCGARVYLCKR